MAHLDHLRGRVASGLGSAAFTSCANCLKKRWEVGACEPPKMQARARGSWNPQPPRPGGDLRSFLVVEAVEEDRHCPEADPREAAPSRRPRKVGPANSPPEDGRATPGDGRASPSILHLGHLRVCSLDCWAWARAPFRFSTSAAPTVLVFKTLYELISGYSYHL